jgi:hypothetical protein
VENDFNTGTSFHEQYTQKKRHDLKPAFITAFIVMGIKLSTNEFYAISIQALSLTNDITKKNTIALQKSI